MTKRQRITTLLGSASLISLVNVCTTLLTVVSGLYVVRQLESQAYGQYAYMVNVFMLMTLLLGFGLTGQIAKDIAEQHGAPADFRARQGGLIALRLGTALLAVLIGSGLWAVTSDNAYLYAGMGAACFMWMDFAIGYLSGAQRLRRVSLLLCVQPGVFMALVAIVPVGSVPTVYALFLVSQLAGALAGWLLMLGLPGLTALPSFRAVGRLRLRDTMAGQMYLAVLLQTAYSSYGVSLLGALKEFDGAGRLSIALTVVRLLPVFAGTLISVLYYPRLCALVKQGNEPELQRTTYGAHFFSIVVAAGATAVLVVYSDVIISLLYTARHASAAPLLELIAPLSFLGVADILLTWDMLAMNETWKALIPLIVRTLLIAVTLPLAFVIERAWLADLLAIAYVGSSVVAWLLQVHFSRALDMWRTLGLTATMTIFGLIIGWVVRYAVPWPRFAYAGIGDLALAVTLYAVCGIGLMWFWLAKNATFASERA